MTRWGPSCTSILSMVHTTPCWTQPYNSQVRYCRASSLLGNMYVPTRTERNVSNFLTVYKGKSVASFPQHIECRIRERTATVLSAGYLVEHCHCAHRGEWILIGIGGNGVHILIELIMRWILSPMTGIIRWTYGKLWRIYAYRYLMEYIAGYGPCAGSSSV